MRAAIKPHLTDYWIMSDFSQPDEERCSAVCGLYVDPPENVLVVSIDEKTGIQAKAPTKADAPPAPGRPARREHEYTRNGTQCLFAALKVHLGDVLAMSSKTRNRFDLIRFLGSSLFRVGDDVELADGEVDHRDVVACRAVAAGAAFGGLDEAVEAFEQPVGDPGFKPADDAEPVLLAWRDPGGSVRCL